MAVVFVSGASGFVGRHVCACLIHHGHTVHAVVRREDVELKHLGVKLWLGDLWDRDIAAQAIKHVTHVIHCAGDAIFGNGAQYQRANVELTQHLISIIKEQCTYFERFVFVSTIGAVDRPKNDMCVHPLTEDSPAHPTSDYGRSKYHAESLLCASGIPFSIVRPTMVVGPDMRRNSHFAVFIRHALARAPISRIAWSGQFSVIHVDDLAEGLLCAATHKDAAGKTFFCAGEAISVAACFQLSNPTVWRLPVTWAVPLLRPLSRWIPFSLKAMLFPALTASDARLQNLGWKPRYSAKAALEHVIAREQARRDVHRDPAGQTVITGAGSGLGRALVEKLAPLRKQILLVDCNQASLQAVTAQFPHCRTAVVDLANDAEIDTLLGSDAWNAYPVSEIYACAGIGIKGKMQDIAPHLHLKMFRVNVLARLRLAQHAIDAMRRRQFGRIVFISSSSAFQPLPYMATYAATNSALLSLGEAWAQETADLGVHLMTVCPGGMKTNFQKSGGVKEIEGEKLMLPQDVAQHILTGLNQHKMTLIVSFRSLAMSLLARCLPRKMCVRLWGTLMSKMR